jgi:hypothetical protein
MRDRLLQPDHEMLGPVRMPVMRERSDASVVRAAMDLQQRAGNRTVAELVARSHVDPAGNPLAALAGAGRMSASAGGGGSAGAAGGGGSAGAGGGGAAVSVQREPCIDCPDAANALAAAGPETEAEAEPGQTG